MLPMGTVPDDSGGNGCAQTVLSEATCVETATVTVPADAAACQKVADLTRRVRRAEAELGTFHPITVPSVCNLEGLSALMGALRAANGTMDVVGLNCYWPPAAIDGIHYDG